MKKLIPLAGVLAFFLALGIVGSVEHGAPVARLLWLVPLLAVMAGCMRTGEKNG